MTALVVAVVTAAIVVLTPAPRSTDSTPTAPSATAPSFDTPSRSSVRATSRPIPMNWGDESFADCPAEGPCSGQMFTLNLGGDGPWMVTEVSYRPFEILPDRRVTRVRWEFHVLGQSEGRDTVSRSLAQDASNPDAMLTHLHLGREGYRAMRITAVVEASIPVWFGEVRTYLGPFHASGYQPFSGEAEFPARVTPGAVTWSHDTTPMGPSR